MSSRKHKIPKHQHAAGLAAARMALKSLCWVTIQTPGHDYEVTAYVNFRTMRVFPWNAQSASIRQVMNAQAYNWRVWWVLKMDSWDGVGYRITPLSESQNNRRNLKDLLQDAAGRGRVSERRRRALQKLRCAAIGGVMFLTKKEVAELTGAGFRHLQIESLVANGIRHTIRRDGWPAVPRSAVIGGKPDAKEKTEAGGWQPRKAS